MAGVLLVTLAGCATVATSTQPGNRPPEIARAAAEPAQVRVQGDTLYYTGNMSKASTVVFDAAVAGLAKGSITRLVISSGGGDTVEGRHVGRWVQAMGLVVEVDTICFSSCANFVFPAGRARVVRPDAFVGWHGDDRQYGQLARLNGTSLDDELKKAVPVGVPPDAAATFLQEFRDTVIHAEAENLQYYQSLGVNHAFSVCAVGDMLKQRCTQPELMGWGFSVEDMVRLGMRNTLYLGEGRFETDSKRFNRYLCRITADECTALMK